MKRTTSNIFFVCGLYATTVFAGPPTETVHSEFTEDFGGPKPGFRYKIKNVRIAGKGNIIRAEPGQLVPVSMEILHDCTSCGNAVNQVIVGLGGQDRAQASVWNGKNRSGGPLMIVNGGSSVAAYAQDNPGKAQWVKVYFSIHIPKQPGIYYLRSRYAQDYVGRLMTLDAKSKPQPDDSKALGWWRVDRPNGPGSAANIGAFIVE